MDARYYTGDDTRDSLAPDDSADDCHFCRARWHEPCEDDCQCEYCIGRRAREAALLALDVVPEDAA